MPVKVTQKNAKEIIALDQFEAVRLRPGMWLGQVSIVEERIPIIRDGKLIIAEKPWSPGFMHLIVEILENSLDEAKRMRGKMKAIHVEVDLDTNRVTIIDEGGGFHKANSKHPKTRKNVVRTAMEELHAGSNFVDSSTNILGTHGVGSAVVNMLSTDFSCTTVNSTSYVHYDWKDYKVTNEERRRKLPTDKRGTQISFIPTEDVFPGYKWDEELIRTYLSFKNFIISLDPKLKNLKIDGKFVRNGVKEDIGVTKDFLPEQHVAIKNDLGNVLLWTSYEDSASVSFVNGSRCTGIHQKIVNDWINDHFGYQYSHHFCNTLISLDVPSQLMRFGDQNKSKYDVTRFEIEELMEEAFKSKLLRALKNSPINKEIEDQIEDKLYAENLRKIRKASRTSKRKISDKYSPSSRKKEILYITEGLSAAGSVKQARNSEVEGVYALKGKIKNTKKLSDLTENKEVLEIMSILGLDPEKNNVPQYENVVIATDEDPDGQHIAALIINFFHKWFPDVIKDGRLKKLVTPLIVCDWQKERKYFYSLDEFAKFSKIRKPTNVNYLKGLGSLDLEDWEWVMENKVLFQIVEDRSANKSLDIIFGDSPKKRKEWLEG